MVPFMKASSEIQADKAKAFAADAQRMMHFLPVNDDKGTAACTGTTEAKVANE